jgi:VWFA-related protein
MNRFVQSSPLLPVTGLLLAGCLIASPLLAQRKPDRRQFAETVEVLTVEIPVQVIADGEPVRGLTAENFEVYEGRKRQPLTGFEVVDLEQVQPAALAPREIPISARRHFLLLFDLTFSQPTVVSRAREAALNLVETQFHATDLVAVATYSNQHGPQLILGFTPDRRQVQLAIETLGLPQLLERAADPLAFVIADQDFSQFGHESADAQTGDGRRNFGGMFEAQLADYSVGFDRAQRGEQQGQVLALTTALEDLAKALHDVQGRKHVVYLSEGFDASVILGTDDAQRSAEMAADIAAGEYWKSDSEERYGSTGTLSALQTMLEEFRRADCAIQAVDVGGLRAGRDARARAGGQDSLFMMSKETGGELYRNFNDLGGAMKSMLDRHSVTYVLAYQPEGLKLDGDFHRLRIELKGVPRGARVVHRPGFYAPQPFSERSAMEKRLEAADKILSGVDSGSFGTSVLAAPFRAEAGRAYVPVLIEIDGPSLLAGLSGDALALEIYAYAIAADGTVGDFLSQNMGLELAKVRPALEQRGLKFFGDLILRPGDYTLRVLVRDAQNGRSATRILALAVPEFGSGGPTLAMPLFPEAANQWLIVQEATGTEARRDRPYPFQLEGNAYMPAAKPVLAADGEAQFIVLGYNLGDGSVPLETQFLTADGATVEGPTISFVSRGEGATPESTQLVLSLAANGLPAGEYRLVTSLEGQSRTTSIPFVVAAKGS